MICGHFVKPRSKRPGGVVLVQFVSNLHENFHGCVFCIFAGWKSSAAETENGRSKFSVQVTPSLGIPCPGPGNDCAGIPCVHRIHPVWHPACFLDVHRLVRKATEKITLRWAATQEWIADPDVARGGQLQPLALRIVQRATVRADAVRRCVRNECRQVRIGKIGMIQKVVRLKAKLELESLRNGSVLEKGEIELPEMRSNE